MSDARDNVLVMLDVMSNDENLGGNSRPTYTQSLRCHKQHNGHSKDIMSWSSFPSRLAKGLNPLKQEGSEAQRRKA